MQHSQYKILGMHIAQYDKCKKVFSIKFLNENKWAVLCVTQYQIPDTHNFEEKNLKSGKEIIYVCLLVMYI